VCTCASRRSSICTTATVRSVGATFFTSTCAVCTPMRVCCTAGTSMGTRGSSRGALFFFDAFGAGAASGVDGGGEGGGGDGGVGVSTGGCASWPSCP
jgi:hypothetical protein